MAKIKLSDAIPLKRSYVQKMKSIGFHHDTIEAMTGDEMHFISAELNKIMYKYGMITPKHYNYLNHLYRLLTSSMLIFPDRIAKELKRRGVHHDPIQMFSKIGFNLYLIDAMSDYDYISPEVARYLEREYTVEHKRQKGSNPKFPLKPEKEKATPNRTPLRSGLGRKYKAPSGVFRGYNGNEIHCISVRCINAPCPELCTDAQGNMVDGDGNLIKTDIPSPKEVENGKGIINKGNIHYWALGAVGVFALISIMK